MIVDTSALAAILFNEEGVEPLRRALVSEAASLPAPAALEFFRVADRRSAPFGEIAREMIAELVADGLAVVPFDEDHARIAGDANARYGKGLGQGGTLNLLDLMIYAVAKERGEPLLCTGQDFAATDLEVHAASRSF